MAPTPTTLKPDINTRIGRQIATGKVQCAVRDENTGFTCYVMIEPKRKKAGGGYERGAVPLAEATHVFVSEKGYGTPRIGTYYPPKPGYDTGRFFAADNASSAHVMAFQIVVQVAEGIDPGQFTVTSEDRCAMCWHRLEDPESIERGIGPECAGKPTATKVLHSRVERPQLDMDSDPEREPTVSDELRAEAEAVYMGQVVQAVNDAEQKRREDLIRNGYQPTMEDFAKDQGVDPVKAQLDSVREQIRITEAQRDAADARLEQLRAQEQELTEDVPF